ncbi:terminase small subunit [Salmonella enterica subsp. salamae]|nr:hypothetical protein [Salmonella enterica]EDV0905044.1 terminase small subunit [Salmonella enterica subsp. salamae]
MADPFLFPGDFFHEREQKKLAEIFGCDVRTVTAWQSQGLPLVSGGGKGNEAVFDTAAAIS